MVFTWLQAALLIFMAAGLAFAAGPLLGSILLAPKAVGGAIGEPFECGIPTHGSSLTRFGINYYFYAIVFLAFEVDILYLFPVATWFNHSVGFAPVWKILVFLGVLGLAVVYFQRKGVFEWPRRIQISPRP